MYTFNYFVYGHDLSKDREINNGLNDVYDFTIHKNINGREYQISFPYHGGQVAGDTYSCVFGHIITDDCQNKNYIDEVRYARKEQYEEEYKEFLQAVFEALDEDEDISDSEDLAFVEKLKNFLKENEPDFYSVEVSS